MAAVGVLSRTQLWNCFYNANTETVPTEEGQFVVRSALKLERFDTPLIQ